MARQKPQQVPKAWAFIMKRRLKKKIIARFRAEYDRSYYEYKKFEEEIVWSISALAATDAAISLEKIYPRHRNFIWDLTGCPRHLMELKYIEM